MSLLVPSSAGKENFLAAAGPSRNEVERDKQKAAAQRSDQKKAKRSGTTQRTPERFRALPLPKLPKQITLNS
jgi:hypothetical protein